MIFFVVMKKENNRSLKPHESTSKVYIINTAKVSNHLFSLGWFSVPVRNIHVCLYMRSKPISNDPLLAHNYNRTDDLESVTS